jgi:hypothetical protein
MSRITLVFFLASALVASSPVRSYGASVSACGQIESMDQCLWFWRFDSPGIFILPDSIVVEPGIYHVSGESYTGTPTCGHGYYSTYLRDISIEPCVPEILGCGRIAHTTEEYDCLFFVSLTGHGNFSLEGLDGFAVGDTVLATGTPCRICPAVPGICDDAELLVFNIHLVACPDSLIPVHDSTWGQIKARYQR